MAPHSNLHLMLNQDSQGKSDEGAIVDEVNPFVAPSAEAPSVEIETRLGERLGWFAVLAGLTVVGASFGACFTICLVAADRFSFWVGLSPVGAPSPSQALECIAVFGLFGLAGGVFATPLLIICNRRNCLGFRSAFSSIATIGTIVFLVIAATADPTRALPPFTPRATNWVTFGCLVWLSSLFAALAYGLWIYLSQRCIPRYGQSARTLTPTTKVAKI